MDFIKYKLYTIDFAKVEFEAWLNVYLLLQNERVTTNNCYRIEYVHCLNFLRLRSFSLNDGSLSVSLKATENLILYFLPKILTYCNGVYLIFY